MRIIIFGGDGFCGWPTSLHLSMRGHTVLIVDSLVRRAIDVELEIDSLTPISPISVRRAAWNEITGYDIGFERVDVAEDFYGVQRVLEDFRPNALVHFAEQRAAPYSMKSERHKRYTVNNNVAATHNILCALVESGIDAHLLHLGTMGVYGYGGGARIPEGYLNVEVLGVNGDRIQREILHPTDPGSVYHMTKTLDQLLFYFYNKNDRIRITDLHQGVVWGTNTPETMRDERLINRFDYDGDYGTVLNRFLTQAAVGHPLTVHGNGGQTRAFIHIADTVRCIELAIQNPPPSGDRVQIFNQMTEVHRVRELAEIVSRLTGAPIQFLKNPRNEAPENDLPAEAKNLVALGLKPTLLEESILFEVINVAKRYADRCDFSKIPCTSIWRKDTVPS